MGSHTPTPENHTQQQQQQYCLRWNNYQNNLTNVFDQLLQAEAFVDVTLSAEGHSLKAHKVVLCACSPYFQALFFDNPCKHPIVILNGVKWTQLKVLVEFMYRGEINVQHDHLAPLLKVAELLKIRGLADVSRSGSGHPTGGNNTNIATTTASNDNDTKRPNPADFLSNSNHSHSGSEASTNMNGASIISRSQSGQSGHRKRRKMSTPERTPSPLGADDDHDLLQDTSDPSDLLQTDGNLDDSLSINPILPSDIQLHRVAAAGGLNLLNLHAAAAAAAAVATPASNASVGGSSQGGNSSSSTGGNDLDIKPGIVEMIREEERAKMLESAHGWLAPGNSGLSESYQYQIQNLWQKCWNQNQGGMMHALRFRERGPLKSWRPETMAEAIFAVLREGLSLSQAARKYDIPYPTFVLYANRVHNMLGPSADGSSSNDLLSDMRPKGRGRPQRILLGSWPEEHIRGVIRAVVFRDTQSKDDLPFVFNRDGTLCLPQPGNSSSSGTGGISASSTATNNNGMDMSLHFGQTPQQSSPEIQPRHTNSSSSSNSSSPLHQALNSSSSSTGGNLLNFTGTPSHAQVQAQLLSFQQQTQRQLQQFLGTGASPSRRNSSSSVASLDNLKNLKSGSSSTSGFPFANLAGLLNPMNSKLMNESMKEIFQIKAEVGNEEDDDDVLENEDEEDEIERIPENLILSKTSENNNAKGKEDESICISPVSVVQVQMMDKTGGTSTTEVVKTNGNSKVSGGVIVNTNDKSASSPPR